MASKSKTKKIAKKAAGKAKGGGAKPGVTAAITGAGKVAAGIMGLKGGGGAARAYGRSRRKGPTWWANRVLVEKLKKRYYRLKFGSLR